MSIYPTPLSQSFAGVGVAVRRELEARAAGLLSERDVHALPDWTEVEIIWSGGNGPHRYLVVHVYGEPYAVLPPSNPWHDPTARAEIAAGRVPRNLGDPINFVGAEQFTTWVRLPTDAPWPKRRHAP